MKLFVYGTLRQGYGNHGLIRHCQKIADATIPATLYVNGWLPMIGTQKDPTHRVVGEVYELLGKDTVERVDRLEGHPNWYRREEVEATTTDGQKIRVWAYFMPDAAIQTPRSGARILESGDYTQLEW